MGDPHHPPASLVGLQRPPQARLVNLHSQPCAGSADLVVRTLPVHIPHPCTGLTWRALSASVCFDREERSPSSYQLSDPVTYACPGDYEDRPLLTGKVRGAAWTRSAKRSKHIPIKRHSIIPEVRVGDDRLRQAPFNVKISTG
jgi:hypothetical protein